MAEPWTEYQSTTPPPPKGPWEDYGQGPSGVSAEGLPVYSVTSKQPSTWDRMVTAYGEFVNPFGEPTPGESFDERFKKIAIGLSEVPLHMSESASGFGKAVLDRDLPGAAHHLVGLIPFLGPGAQQVEQDIAENKWPEAIAHTFGLITMARPDLPVHAVERGIEAAPRVGAGLAEGVKTGAKASIAPATLKYHGIPIELPVPATLATIAAGAETGQYIPHVGGWKGAAIGATVPFGKGFIEGYRRGTAAYDAAGRVGETRTPVWEQPPGGGGNEPPPPPGGAFIGPLQRPILPSGRMPGAYPGEPQPPPPPFWEEPIPRIPWREPAPQGATLRDVAQQAATPEPAAAGAQTLSDIAAAAERPTATPGAAEGGAPLSEVATPKPKRGRKPKAGTEPAPLSAVAEAAPTAVEPAGPPIETPETQAPALPTSETYAHISRQAKSERLARHLADTGTTLDDLATWGEPEWKQLGKDLGDKSAPSPSTVVLVRDKLAQLEQTGSIATSPTQSLAQSLFDSGVTHDDTLRYGPDQWKRAAEAAGVEAPKPGDMAEIRGRLKLLDTARGKIDVGTKLGDYLRAQGVTHEQAATFNPRQWQNYGAAAGVGKPKPLEVTAAIADLRRNPPAAKGDLAATLEASIDAAKVAKEPVPTVPDYPVGAIEPATGTSAPPDILSPLPQQVKLYRGRGGGTSTANYFSTDREFARNFTRSGRDSEIVSIEIPQSEILDLGSDTPFAGDVDAIDAAKVRAKASGATGFYVSEGAGQPRSVFFLKPQRK